MDVRKLGLRIFTQPRPFQVCVYLVLFPNDNFSLERSLNFDIVVIFNPAMMIMYVHCAPCWGIGVSGGRLRGGGVSGAMVVRFPSRSGNLTKGVWSL